VHRIILHLLQGRGCMGFSDMWNSPFMVLCKSGFIMDQSDLLNNFQRQSQSYFMTGSLPPISSSWRQAPWDQQPVFFSLNPCGHSPYVTSYLTRGWVRLLWICLTFCQVYISHI
jgi:hypothetical protein